MKVHFILLLSLLFICQSQESYGQNLVPNPSFEDYILCPDGTNRLDWCLDWFNYGNSPEYFNACTGPSQYGLPLNYGFGFQYAHTGNGMAGVATYRIPNSPSGPNYREFIGTSLLQPLVIGQKYYISFFTNFSHTTNVGIATNNNGIRLSTLAYDSCCPPPINNWAHLYSDSVISDSTQWIKISGAIIADSAYTHIAIGNFFEDILTDTMNVGPTPNYGLYFIDDICLSTDSVYNSTWTSIDKIHKETLNLHPNPSAGNFYIAGNCQCNKISIYNKLGEKMKFNCNFNSFNTCLELVQPQGIYFLIYNDESHFISEKIIINP